MEHPIVTGYPPPLMTSQPPIDPHAPAYVGLPGAMGGMALHTPPSQYQTPAKAHAMVFAQELPAEPVVLSLQAQQQATPGGTVVQQQHGVGAHPSPAPSTYSQPSSNPDLAPQQQHLSPTHTGTIQNGVHSLPNGPVAAVYNGQTPSPQGFAHGQQAAMAYHAAGTPTSNHSSPAVTSPLHGQSPVTAGLQIAPNQTSPPFQQQSAQHQYPPVSQQQPTYQPSVQHAMPPPQQVSYAQPQQQIQQPVRQPQYHSQQPQIQQVQLQQQFAQSQQQSQVIPQHTQLQYQHQTQQPVHHGQPQPQSQYAQQQPGIIQQPIHVQQQQQQQQQQGRPASQIISQYNPQQPQFAQSVAQTASQGAPQQRQQHQQQHQPPLQQHQQAQAIPQLQTLQQQGRPSPQSPPQQQGQPQQFLQQGVGQQHVYQTQPSTAQAHMVQQPYHQQPQGQILHQGVVSQPQVSPSTAQQQAYQTMQTAGQGTLHQQQQQVQVPFQAQGYSQQGASLPTTPQQPVQYAQQQPQAQLQPGVIYYNGQQYAVASPQLPAKQAKSRIPSSGASQKAAVDAMAKGFKRAFKSVDQWSQKHMANVPQPSPMKPAGQAPAQPQAGRGQAPAYATATAGYSTMSTTAKPQMLVQNSQYAVQQPLYQQQVPVRVPVGGHAARPVSMAATGTVQSNTSMGHRVQQVSNPVNQFQPIQSSVLRYQTPLPAPGPNNVAGSSVSSPTGQRAPSQSSPGQAGQQLPQHPLPAGHVGYGVVPNQPGAYIPTQANPQHHLAIGHGAGTSSHAPNTVTSASQYNSPGMYPGFLGGHTSTPVAHGMPLTGAPSQQMYAMPPPPAQNTAVNAPLASAPGQSKDSQGLAAHAPKIAAGAAAIALVGTAAALGTKGGMGKKFLKGHHGGGGGHAQQETAGEDQQQFMTPSDSEAAQADSFAGGGDLSGLSGGFDPSGEASSAFAAQSAMADVGAANSMSLIDDTTYTMESAADVGARGGDPAAGYDQAAATEAAFADQGAANSMSLIDDTTYTVDPDVGVVYDGGGGGGGDTAAYDPALATESAFADQGAANSMSLIDDTTYTVEPAADPGYLSGGMVDTTAYADPSAGFYDPSAAGGSFIPADAQLYHPAYDPSQFAADPAMMGFADQSAAAGDSVGVFDGGAGLDTGVLEDSGGLSESVAAAAEGGGGIDWGGLMESVSSWGF